MITRFRVNGFKNLVNVDLSFGSFTCIAGANGVGKSNLFDAIRFLSSLADQTLVDAARSVRDDTASNWDVRSMFRRIGHFDAEPISFVVDMIIPQEGSDDVSLSVVKATSTYLRYELELEYVPSKNGTIHQPLRIVKEILTPIPRGDANKELRFEKSKEWLASVVTGRRTTPYISTNEGKIHLHQDQQKGMGGGRTFQHVASALSRTVVCAANSFETPTVLLAKHEMKSWRILQLEPSALRRHDTVDAPRKMTTQGEHLPATLNRLAQSLKGDATPPSESAVYTRIANRLYELLGEIKNVHVDHDERRDTLTLTVTDRQHSKHQARSLSDGTLRFLALSTLAEDPEEIGVICLEEPENGIHPARITAMLKLLRDIACDPWEPVGIDNPFRQVIINTHSPVVVTNVDDDSLLVARTHRATDRGVPFDKVVFHCVSETWRSKIEGTETTSPGAIQEYLQPMASEPGTEQEQATVSKPVTQRGPRSRRIKNRRDLTPSFI